MLTSKNFRLIGFLNSFKVAEPGIRPRHPATKSMHSSAAYVKMAEKGQKGDELTGSLVADTQCQVQPRPIGDVDHLSNEEMVPWSHPHAFDMLRLQVI